MAFRYRRSGGRYRRNYRRRTLSSYSIATRTGARSQARQIYALNRRITAIQRMTKPEIVTYNQNFGGTNGSTAEGVYTYTATQVPNNIDGDFARLLSSTWYISANYNTMSEDVQPVTLRVVLVQLRASRSNALLREDIFESNSTASSLTQANARNDVFGPLTTGLSGICRVLADRKIYLSYQRPQGFTRIISKRLLNFRITDASESIEKGTIMCFITGYSPAALDISVNLNSKLAYTDA